MSVLLLGNGDIDTEHSGRPNYLLLYRFQAVTSGLLVEIKVKLQASYKAIVAIYSDDSGDPFNVLETSVEVNPAVDGWNALAIGGVNIVAGTYYWLALQTDGDRYYNTSGVPPGTVKSKAYAYNVVFPSPAGSGYTDNNINVAIAGWGNVSEWCQIIIM
jgi:hypothetical protein